MLEVGHEFSEEGIAVGTEPGRYGMTRLTTVHRTATEKQNDLVYIHSRAWIRHVKHRSATTAATPPW